jgi:thiol-disulfide isomerase/thioredoxin
MKLALAMFCLAAGVGVAADPVTLSLPDLSGNSQTLEQYRGRVIVLNFWATWCVPCRAEMPLLVDIQDRYAARGVVVVGASADDESTKDQIKPFVEKLRITFPIWTGATIAQMEKFGVGAALPATAIIDPQGQIAFRIMGILERKDLTRRLDYLLSGRRGKSPEPVIDTLSTAKQDHEGHEHGKEEEHTHGGVGVEGASMVPS